MKIEKYALLDTDFISKTHFIHGDTEKCLVDLVVEMPGYCFFCHSQIIKELSRHNQQAIGWLQHKISEQKIQCYTDEEILNDNRRQLWHGLLWYGFTGNGRGSDS